tara:strand:+ start:542 stop:979 length:438 start_codon:yes stop_codon:yes gene_type:complete
MPIKSFRGKIADGAIDTVTLHTNDGSIGYRIVKLQGMSAAPGAAQEAHVIKIYKVPQTTVDGLVDLSDNTLIATVFFTNRNDELHSNEDAIIADNEIFNQDIYITHSDIQSNTAGNYYLELEQVKLDLSQNTVATLKDIRNITSQ